MKLIITGDWHIRSSNPENRIDNYEETLWEKLNFICNQEGLLVLQPGDIFDGPIQSNQLMVRLLKFFNEKKYFKNKVTFSDFGILCCRGQHDLRYRNAGNTALDVLAEGGPIKILSDVPYVKEEIHFYGSSFNEEIPEINDESAFNILVTHRMIIEEKIWEGQTDYIWANVLLRTTGFALIISGDNHKGFIVPYKNKLLVNCGSLLRSSKDQFDHKPFIVIYDTDTRKYEKIFIPIKPASEVFDMEKIEREEEKNEKLEAFIQGLSEHKEIGLDFQANLFSYMKFNEIEEKVQTIVKENFDKKEN